MKIYGWEITRDERGFWLTAGGLRAGPFTTPLRARAYGRVHPAPPPKKDKPRAKAERLDT